MFNGRNHSKGIRILLPARAENVSLIRHAITGSAEALGMGDTQIADLKTVVTEACMNVVSHAYEGEPGPLEVRAWPEAGELVVVVRDDGGGIQPRAATEGQSLRLGLSLIASMTSAFEIAGGDGQGTRITMRLRLGDAAADSAPGTDDASGAAASGADNASTAAADDGAAVPDPADGERGAPDPTMLNGTPDSIALTAWDSEALGPILSRVVAVLAARVDLPVDRLSDAILFSDAISEDIDGCVGDDGVNLTMADCEDGLDLGIGPLAAGGAARIREGLDLPEEVGGSLESLAAAVETETRDGGEYLVARFTPGQ
ncbi:MAG TPA: ATP-binding protein [Solirubrobacterales bacterium]|nr:ATP-binding protein [Solirubrobacterales bacterium]HZK16307.1 ATP-binding protein [Solirubrobacterales bacterium]